MVDEGFREFLIARIRRSTLPARKLCFEITETSAVRDLSRAQELIIELRALGCAFALDDFGTGFCSFDYLRSLDVDYLKIDGSFIRNLADSALVRGGGSRHRRHRSRTRQEDDRRAGRKRRGAADPAHARHRLCAGLFPASPGTVGGLLFGNKRIVPDDGSNPSQQITIP
ncbi:MAG: EAL domain-containing protein [Sphingopyxis sp.]|nr:EAL domain-containing protein [Sphingopyxis sp.]